MKDNDLSEVQMALKFNSPTQLKNKGGQKRPLEENEHENIRKLKKQRISESSSSETDTTPTRDQIAKGKKNNLAPFHQLNYQSSPPNSNRNRNNKKFPTYNKNHNNPKQP